MVNTYKLTPRNNVLVFVQILINVFSVFGCQWNYWGSLGPWLALSHELGHNLNFDHDNSMYVILKLFHHSFVRDDLVENMSDMRCDNH